MWCKQRKHFTLFYAIQDKHCKLTTLNLDDNHGSLCNSVVPNLCKGVQSKYCKLTVLSLLRCHDEKSLSYENKIKLRNLLRSDQNKARSFIISI